MAFLLPVQLEVVAKRNRNPVSLYKTFRQEYILSHTTLPPPPPKKNPKKPSNKPGSWLAAGNHRRGIGTIILKSEARLTIQCQLIACGWGPVCPCESLLPDELSSGSVPRTLCWALCQGGSFRTGLSIWVQWAVRGSIAQWGELVPRECNKGSALGSLCGLGRVVPNAGSKPRFVFDFIFFISSRSQQENICFFYTFLVYLSWDLQLCCCCSVCFNTFEALAVFLVPKLSGCPCCLYLRSYLASACHEPRTKDREKIMSLLYILLL